MEAVCARDDGWCEARALSGALHALHLYCAAISSALICCCAPVQPHWHSKRWRGQTARGVASLLLGITWCCGAAAAFLRSTDTVYVVSAVMAPLAWLAATAFHITLWTRRSGAPILYLAIYWFLTAVSTAAILWKHVESKTTLNHVELYIQAIATVLAVFLTGVDCICFYDEVAKRRGGQQKPNTENENVTYKYHDTYFWSKIAFFWLNPLLYKGYLSPLEQDDLGELPENEKSKIYYEKFKRIYFDYMDTKKDKTTNLWHCYVRTVWPNFYFAGILKLIGDLISVIPPLGLAVIIKFIEEPPDDFDGKSQVTIDEYLSNGYIMLFIVTVALVSQAFLSQNSTHLVTVEGTRLKTGLQSMLYDKCMRLAPWSSPNADDDEESPLLNVADETTTPSGLLTNLMSQDTYNVMSCVWICHYLWAIPLKVTVILYLLYTKLGISAIIGAATSVIIITPLQFYIGKKLSENSKDISKWTDHRISKMTEILQGINVIKLYVWEDLFKEKILNLREVELKLLNKDSVYWSFLTFTTQVSTILLTIITFSVYYFMEDNKMLTASNVFAGLALFNQLTVPLLILPVTVLMVIQAMVSTRRIKDFLDFPEANNVMECNDTQVLTKQTDILNNAFINSPPDDALIDNVASKDELCDDDNFSDDENTKLPNDNKYLVQFRNAAFTWGMKSDVLLEIDDLDIPAGKLIMVVGSTGSGKTSLLSAILGEMYLERGEVNYSSRCCTWYCGQPPWLLQGSVRDNIVLGGGWCPKRYARVLRATGLRPDLQLLPEGDTTRLGNHGSPLSGGQRVRVALARALYSNARLLALDEPLAALDPALAQHVAARALLTAARAGRTVVVATNRLELLHYADMVIAMEEGRVSAVGRPNTGNSALSRWTQLAGAARATTARVGAGPPGGSARERDRLRRALSRARFQRSGSDNTGLGITEPAGAHLLAEVGTCAGGSWRRTARVRRPLSRQLSSPPPSVHNYKWRREVRRAVSAGASNATLQREASLLRRLLRARPHRTLARWTPRTLRRLLSSESDTHNEDNPNNGNVTDVADETGVDSTFTSLTSNGVEPSSEVTHRPARDNDDDSNERASWYEYVRACGWRGAVYVAAAAAAQALSVAADCWLPRAAADPPVTEEQMWNDIRLYAVWCVCGASMSGLSQAASACAGARARRTLHERLLHSTLHAPLYHHQAVGQGSQLHRFSADIQVIDKKLPIAMSRWAQLALLCSAAMLVNAVIAPWSLLALIPAIIVYFTLQSVYLCNARELQRAEAVTAAGVVSLSAEAGAGAATVRAGRLQAHMRAAFRQRLDRNQNALLLLNAANRWLGLTLDLVGALTACASLLACLYARTAVSGLAGAHALLLPAYAAHVAKCRADLHQLLAAVRRVCGDAAVRGEDYREDCPIPQGWQRNGKIVFDNVTVQPEPGAQPILNNINLSVAPGQKVAICGRSGSGKSSLLLTCVGATTIQSGQLSIDEQNVRSVPLRALRHRMVLLPQEPVMFSGTLRENLDPLAVHTDEEIWQCLRAVGLFDYVTAQPAGLECSVGGARWCSGRAARVCGARAALHARSAAALLLDEPGAALSAAAERGLLAALAARAPHAAILTVAHRISSIRGYDSAVVLEDGNIVEHGEVSALLAQPSSRLARMLATVHSEI